MIRNSFYAAWDRWANFHPLLRFLLAAVLLGAIALLGGKPVWRAFKSWRMGRNLAAARVAVADSRMADARDLSLTVLRSGDPSIEAYRILEESTRSLGDPRHPEIARALMSLPESSPADRWEGFRAVAAEMPLGVVGQAWVALPVEVRREPGFAVAFADRLLAEEHLGEASSVLLAVPEADRPGAVQRGLIRALILSGRREGYTEAQRLIATDFPENPADAAAWLDLLEQIPPIALDPGALSRVREILLRQGESIPARDALVLDRISYAADFNRRAPVIEEAIGRFRESDPVPLAGFLTDLGLFSRLAEIFPNESVANSPGLLPLLLRALQQTAAWQRESELLDAHGGLLPRYELLARRAIVAAKSGDTAALASQWGAALDEAKSVSGATAYLALRRLAGDAGMQDEAEQALIAAIRTGRGPLPLYADLKPLLQSLSARDRENALLEICAIYLSLEPSNPVLLTQYAYLALLNRLATPETIIEAMKPLAGAFPKELPIQCALAAAYLAGDLPEEAAAVFAPLEIVPEKLAPAYRAVWLATRVATGKLEKSAPEIVRFPLQDLHQSERRMFGKWLRE